MSVFLSACVGYFLGSLSPSYILGRVLRGIDIREHGDGNAGTVNAVKVLGLLPGILTGLVDISKGIAAVLFSYELLGLPEGLTFVPAYCAVLGHIFPFYLNFRGGRGAGVAVGILFYFLGLQTATGIFPVISLLVIGAVLAVALSVSWTGEVAGLLAFPLLAYLIPRHAGLSALPLFLSSLCIFLAAVSLHDMIRNRVLSLGEGIRWWRVCLRMASLCFIPIYLHFGKLVAVGAIGAATLAFLVPDIERIGGFDLLGPGGERVFYGFDSRKVYKEGEEGRLSSISIFLIACFLVFLLLPKDIAFMSLLFMIFGDTSSKIFGMGLGRKKLLADRTLEGSLFHFVGCLLSGYVFVTSTAFPVQTFILGAFAATASELLLVGVDDNLSVGLMSGAFMYLTEMA